MLLRTLFRSSLASVNPKQNKNILSKTWCDRISSCFISSQVNPQQNPLSKWPEAERVAMSLSRCRYKRLIKMSCREKGSFPEYNPKLAKLLEVSEGCNLSPEAVDFSIKIVQDNRSRMGLYEVFFPGGGLIVMQYEAVDISHIEFAISNVCGEEATLLHQNQRQNYYNTKAVIVVHSKAEGIPLEESDGKIVASATLAEQIEPSYDENGKMILTAYYDMASLHTAKQKMESLGYHIEEAFVGYVPKVTVKLPKKSVIKVARLLESFSQIPEIDRMYENLK